MQFTINEQLVGGTIEIININGVIVKQFNPENIGTKFKIDLSQEAKGIYFVKLITEQGVSTRKLVLE